MAYEKWTKEDDIKLFKLATKADCFKWNNWPLLEPHFPTRKMSAIKQRAEKLKKNPPKLPQELEDWPQEDLKLMANLYITQGASFKQIQEAISVEATVDEIEEVLELYLNPYRKQVQIYAEEHNIALQLPITSTKLKAFYELRNKSGFYKQALKKKLESYG